MERLASRRIAVNIAKLPELGRRAAANLLTRDSCRAGLLLWWFDFARAATNVTAALASPVAFLQMPIVMPTRDFLPVPRHATQEVVLWPWHLGHNVFVGISPPLGIYLRCNSSRSLVILAAMRRASSRVSSLAVARRLGSSSQ
jgi:hypothetical protein